MRFSTGSMKAAVLPLPVCEETIRSLPAMAGGMAADCTGVGSVKPARSSADNRVGESPRDSKDMCTFASDGGAFVQGRQKGGGSTRLSGSSCRPGQQPVMHEDRAPCKSCECRQGSGRSGGDAVWRG